MLYWIILERCTFHKGVLRYARQSGRMEVFYGDAIQTTAISPLRLKRWRPSPWQNSRLTGLCGSMTSSAPRPPACLAGLTEISDIIAKKMVDRQEIPCDGKLYYRGIDVEKLVAGALKEGRFGFEETTIHPVGPLSGQRGGAGEFKTSWPTTALPGQLLCADVILKAPSQDIMNSLARSVLNLASYDERCDDISLPNVMRQCLQLIALFPVLSGHKTPGLHLQEREQPLHTRPPAGAVHGGEHPLPAAA